LDEAARPKMVEGAFDEIFVGKTPILMGVEPGSLCWVLGQIAENRDGQTWARELDRFTSLEHAITDSGSGLLKGLKLSSQGRSQPLEHSLDVFHTLYEGNRAWRNTESQVWKLNEKAQQWQKEIQRRQRQGASLQGKPQAFNRAQRRAEQALQSAVEIETAWREVRQSLELFTPEGELNTPAAARARLEQCLPRLKGEGWAKTVRLLKRPESLSFLERIERKLQQWPSSLSDEVKRDALRFEYLRRRPKLLAGEDPAAPAARGWWLVAQVRYHKDPEFQQAVGRVGGILRGCWRASSLVECINSVVRMQQARHRKLTPGLISLKRFYWNCRPFRTGCRRKRCPYELLGIVLPHGDWWALLKMTPAELKQELSTQTLSV
jgi:hypothetical protein